MVRRIALLAWLAVTACNFNDGQFKDRACISDQDCPRPDQSCQANLCTQKACTSNADCGAGFAFECTNGGCVASDCSNGCQAGFVCNNDFCQASFNVVSAVSVTNKSISVTFDAPPDATTGTDPANYIVNGLTISGTPTIAGSTVMLSTSSQDVQTYTLTVSGVTRASDQAPLIVDTAMFGGRASFNVVSAVAASSRTVVVTFDAPPDPASATTFANYNIPGLTIADTPIVSGNQVTLPTTAQSQMSYTLTVSNVVRANDAEPLANATAMFTGRNDFNVSGAAALSSHKISVKFDAVPSATQAVTLGNYSVFDSAARPLALSGTPALDTSTSTVTILTATQSATTYTVTVSNVLRAADNNPLAVNTASFAGVTPFDVSSAMSVNSHTITVTYDGAPDPLSATNPANYVVQSASGALTLGTPMVSGNVVTIPTSPQNAQVYTVTVTGVVRAADNEPLTNNTATFTGRTPFDVASANAATSHSVTVTFDAPPNAAQAMVATNYTIPNLTVLAANYSGSGNAVTLMTSVQSTGSYTVTVAGVTRTGDNEPLTNATATFAGRLPFDVTGAAPVTTRTIAVSFDGTPDPTTATMAGNYAIPGLTVTAASLSGSTVTLTTSAPQAAQPYVLTVSNVVRTDAEPLTVKTASFDGRPPFDVSAAASTGNTSISVTFDAAPDMTTATNLSNYAITSGILTLSGTVTLSGNVATITTSAQTANANYTVTVSNVTRASDGEHLTGAAAAFKGKSGFNVVAASSVDATHVSVTFDAPPNAGQAGNAAYYAIPPLTVMAATYTSGNTATLTTTPQAGQTYTVTVSTVTRASDAVALSNNMATFTHVTFNVTSALALTSHSFSVTFDALPDATSAQTLAYYTVTCAAPCTPPTLTGTPALNGPTNTVTISTTAQTGGQVYTVTVMNVTRASDLVALTNTMANFTGIATFDVMSATSLTSASISVTFDAAPTASQATTAGNYVIKDGSNNTLAVTGTPTLSGSTVTIATGAQKAVAYTVTVSNVTRATDVEPLTGNTAMFTGHAQVAPTVTSVSLQSTNPANTVFYNTGTATVVITGTSFASTNCTTAPLAVRLDDLDGLGNAVNTHATSCSVDSDTQITATFPAGIRTNGGSGWNVFVTNTVAESNQSFGDKLLVYAGILVAQIYPSNTGGSGGSAHQFIEFYNPTATAIVLPSVRVRNDMGTTDTALGIGQAKGGHSKTLPSHGFVLLCSKDATASDTWDTHCDATYDETVAGLTQNGSVYVSLGTNAQQQVIDKVGWGSQPRTGGCEGNGSNPCLGSTSQGDSATRKPGPPSGNSTDTDTNRNDFNNWTSTFTVYGSLDGTQP
jgi:hypothetical protein